MYQYIRGRLVLLKYPHQQLYSFFDFFLLLVTNIVHKPHQKAHATPL